MKIADQLSAEVVSNFSGAVFANNYQKAAEFFAADAVWTVMSKGIAGGGDHRGVENIISFLAAVRGLYRPGGPVLAMKNFVALEGIVFVECKGTGEFLDGRSYDNDYAMVFEVADGKITAVREYFDSHYVGSLGLKL